MVDPEVARSPIVECRQRVGHGSRLARSRHPFAQRSEGLVAEYGIQITGHDDRSLLSGNLFHFRNHNPGLLLTRIHPLVVEMGVEVVKFPPRPAVAEFTPHRDAAAHGVPAARGPLRRVAQPEESAVEQDETRFAVEDHQVFAAVGPLFNVGVCVAAHIERSVVVHADPEKIDLRTVRLLKPDDVGVLGPQHFQHTLTPVFPTVVPVGPGLVITDIERHQLQLPPGGFLRSRIVTP